MTATTRGDSLPMPTEWQCSCGRWNPMRKAFCGCGKFWQSVERTYGWLVSR